MKETEEKIQTLGNWILLKAVEIKGLTSAKGIPRPSAAGPNTAAVGSLDGFYTTVSVMLSCY